MNLLISVTRGSSFLCKSGLKSLGSTKTTMIWKTLSGKAPARCLATKIDLTKEVRDTEELHPDKIPKPDRLGHFKSSRAKEVPDPDSLEHFKESRHKVEIDAALTTTGPPPPPGVITLPHPIWQEDQLQKVQITHKPPETFTDRLAFYNVQLLRKVFDILSGFTTGERTERKWLNRISFLETVAGVPGMVAAMLRHMRSLRRLQRDFGWIHTLLEEAENERMHLLTALQLRKPSLLFKLSVIASQGVFVTWFAICYMMSPRFCHRFVGYLEEEAVKTYSKCLEDIEKGPLQHWKTQPAPEVALRYWKLKEDATMKDVILAIRADEAHHRVVNHTLASMKTDQFNPYKPGE